MYVLEGPHFGGVPPRHGRAPLLAGGARGVEAEAPGEDNATGGGLPAR